MALGPKPGLRPLFPTPRSRKLHQGTGGTVFVSGVKNTRTFLKWLKEETGGDSSARIQGNKLVLVPNTADCIQTMVRVLRSIKASKSVSFHTYSLPEDRCTRLLFKGLEKNHA